MRVQCPMVVLQTSHFHPCVLPYARLEGVQLVWVGNLHDHRCDCLVEASTDYLQTLVYGEVVIVDCKLLV